MPKRRRAPFVWTNSFVAEPSIWNGKSTRKRMASLKQNSLKCLMTSKISLMMWWTLMKHLKQAFKKPRNMKTYVMTLSTQWISESIGKEVFYDLVYYRAQQSLMCCWTPGRLLCCLDCWWPRLWWMERRRSLGTLAEGVMNQLYGVEGQFNIFGTETRCSTRPGMPRLDRLGIYVLGVRHSATMLQLQCLQLNSEMVTFSPLKKCPRAFLISGWKTSTYPWLWCVFANVCCHSWSCRLSSRASGNYLPFSQQFLAAASGGVGRSHLLLIQLVSLHGPNNSVQIIHYQVLIRIRKILRLSMSCSIWDGRKRSQQ